MTLESRQINDPASYGVRCYTLSDYQKKSDWVYGSGVYNIEPVDGFEGRYTKVRLVCPVHKEEYTTTLRGMYDSVVGGCKKCCNDSLRVDRRMQVKDLHDKLIAADPTQIYHLDHQPNNRHEKIRITCSVHNITYERIINNALRPTNAGCNECLNEKLRGIYAHSPEDLIEQMKTAHGGIYEYEFPETYNNTKDKIKAICPHHGGFEVSITNHLHKESRCPTCARSPDNQGLTETEKIRPFKLYHILIERDGWIYEKVGITGHTVERRFNRELREGYKITTLAELDTTRYDAMWREFELLNELERQILRYNVVGEMRDFCGWTECFPCGSFDPTPWFK